MNDTVNLIWKTLSYVRLNILCWNWVKRFYLKGGKSGSLLMATVSSLTCLVRIQPSQLLWGNKQEQYPIQPYCLKGLSSMYP